MVVGAEERDRRNGVRARRRRALAAFVVDELVTADRTIASDNTAAQNVHDAAVKTSR